MKYLWKYCYNRALFNEMYVLCLLQTAGSDNFMTFGNNENLPAKAKSFSNVTSNAFTSSNFTVHVDEFASQASRTAALSSQGQNNTLNSRLQLHSGVTALSRPPLQPLPTANFVDDICSPCSAGKLGIIQK